ncbi:MAG: hypothetical protein EBQ85_09945 [Proteobacteria bacterium]|nr:hypothetical protein [Pseudomonadota bacterium]
MCVLEIGGSMSSKHRKNKTRRDHIRRLLSISVFVLGILSFSHTGFAVDFPSVKAQSDTDDILDNYRAYLDFVVAVGRQTDSSNTQKLEKRFAELEKRNPEGAARFLKGLRVELLDKAERLGRSYGRISSSQSEMRKWVSRFMKDWAREADEHLFRTASSELARK